LASIVPIWRYKARTELLSKIMTVTINRVANVNLRVF
jgi:hypothetical protein